MYLCKMSPSWPQIYRISEKNIYCSVNYRVLKSGSTFLVLFYRSWFRLKLRLWIIYISKTIGNNGFEVAT